MINNESQSNRLAATREHLVDMVSTSGPGKRRSRRASVGIVVAAVVVVGAGTTAWAVTRDRPVVDQMTTQCRSGDKVDSFALGVIAGAREGDVQKFDASVRDVCASLWSQGVLRMDVNESYPAVGERIKEDYPVPPLVVCVSDAGSAVVIPSGSIQICGALGLANAS